MKNLNRITMIGQLTADPDTKVVANGTEMSSFGLATNYSWKDSNNEWKTGVDYHRVVTWSNLAKKVGEIYKKGDSIFLEGKLRTNKWVDDEGAKHSRTDIIAGSVLPMTSKKAKQKAAELVTEDVTVSAPQAESDVSEVVVELDS